MSKNVIVDSISLKHLLEVIDEVAWWMHLKEDDMDELQPMLMRLKLAKHAVEDSARDE